MATGHGSGPDRAARSDLLSRHGLPDDLRALARKYPRETWDRHANLGQMARFWLDRHNMFRELGAALVEGAGKFREERVAVRPFIGWLAPRFNFFLGELHNHHMVEDHHYFPVFRAAESRLARGFDILDADHGTIDALLHQLAEAGGVLDAALSGRGDMAAARAALAERLDATLPALLRHLDDEEELVIPLILERTEGALGVG